MQVVAPLPQMPPMPMDMSGPGLPTVIAAIALFALVGLLLVPLVRAWSRRIEGGVTDPIVLDELSHLRERVAELDQSLGRMHELEERLDFAERMLTQREKQRLPEQGRE
ncbi:MAG: hypothetical protein ABIR59_07265 [Gemmatimonadales bacterium]